MAFSDFLSSLFSGSQGNQSNQFGDNEVTAEDFGTNGELPKKPNPFADLLKRLKSQQGGTSVNRSSGVSVVPGGTPNIQQLRPLLARILGRR